MHWVVCPALPFGGTEGQKTQSILRQRVYSLSLSLVCKLLEGRGWFLRILSAQKSIFVPEKSVPGEG